jgi:hypothetical protein
LATKKAATTALTLWEKKMAEAVVKQSAAEKVSGFKSISIEGGVLTVDGAEMDDNEMLGVILCSAHENSYYDKPYVSGQPAIPACFAFSEVDGEEDGMAPHEEAQEKQDEGNACSGCWANVMGTANVGRGKACRNIRRMAVMTADSVNDVDSLNEAEVRLLKIPVMSVKGWASYVKEKLAEVQRPTWGVVTKIKVVPDKKAQFRVTFAFEELITFDPKLFETMEKKIKTASESLVLPYTPMPEEEEAPPPRRGGPAKKTAPIKPTGRMAQAMAASAAKQQAGGSRKAKY